MYVCIHVCGCPRMPEEVVKSLVAGVIRQLFSWIWEVYLGPSGRAVGANKPSPWFLSSSLSSPPTSPFFSVILKMEARILSQLGKASAVLLSHYLVTPPAFHAFDRREGPWFHVFFFMGLCLRKNIFSFKNYWS